MISYKGIEDERLGDAPFIGALLIAPTCTLQCPMCFHNDLKRQEPFISTSNRLIERIKSNPFHEGIIFGGLEWSDTPEELTQMVLAALEADLKVMIYTGRSEEHFQQYLPDLLHLPIWIKFGRYDVTLQSQTHYSMGIKLASTNQYIKYFGGEK